MTGSSSSLRWWEWLFLLVLAGVFGYAGVVKMLHVEDFTHIIARFDLLPESLVNPLALTLPAIEVLLAVALFVPALRRPALLGIVLACIMFASVLLSAIGRGIPVACGCFGSGEKPSIYGAWWAFGRDIILLILAVICYVRQSRQQEPDDSAPLACNAPSAS